MLTQLFTHTVPATTEPLRLIVMCPRAHWPAALEEMIERRGALVMEGESARRVRESEHLEATDVVLICDPALAYLDESNRGELQLLDDKLAALRMMGVIMISDASRSVPEGVSFMCVQSDISADELYGRLAAARQVRPRLDHMEQQVSAMQRLGRKLNEQFVEVDQELRLASRLQHDFLPRVLPEAGRIRFAAHYQPANWVSGDMYDVRHLDDEHIEFFLADAMGHGVAAGLLTMFIKQSVVGKRAQGDSYRILGPSEVLARLNADLLAQDLPNCQFVTGCYARLHIETGLVTFARGGHPHPIRVDARGNCTEMQTVGGLLGVFPDEEYAEVSFRLEPGEKLILYSDGLEDFINEEPGANDGGTRFTESFRDIAPLPGNELISTLRTLVNQGQGSLNPADDQTCLVVEHLPD